MGVDGLTKFLQKNGFFFRRDLSNSIVGIDGLALLWSFHHLLEEPHNFEHLNVMIEKFFSKLLDYNIRAIVFIDEDVGNEEYKRETHLTRLAVKREQVLDYVDFWEKGIYEKNTRFPLRDLAVVQFHQTLQRLEIPTRFAEGEADGLLIDAARNGEIDFILSGDSDMVFGYDDLHWIQLENLDLPHGFIVSNKRILSQTKLSLTQWTRVGLWAGTDVTKPYIYGGMLPPNRPRELDTIIEWARMDQDVDFLANQTQEIQDIFALGYKILAKQEETKVFRGLPTTGGIVSPAHEICFSCWYGIHQMTEQFLLPLIKSVMAILNVQKLTVFDTQDTIGGKPPNEVFELTRLPFEKFANAYIAFQVKQISLQDIPPYVWTVWTEELYKYHRIITLTLNPETVYFPPSALDSIKLSIPQTKKMSDKEMQAQRVGKELPILKYKQNILKEIQEQNIVMISASTGSGKSSQIPQWLIDMDSSFNIIVTQPRRLSTIRICDWVARCRGEQVGGTVGYRIGHGAAKISPQTRLTFCTAGYLTERLLHQANYLNQFDIICLDEVHERSLEMDLLLKIVKENQVRFGYTIVLMSATLNADILQNYFDVDRMPIEIDTQLFPVEVYYTNTVQSILPSIIPPDVQKTAQYLSNCNIDSRCYGAISRYQVNFVVYLIRSLAQRGHATLIFLSGISLILDVACRISEFRSPLFRTVILHSSVIIEDSEVQPDPEKYNIFLASDVAESSITLDCCDLVIDLCISREIVVESGRQVLKSVWSSRDSVKQRKGRTGRVMPGKCVRVIPESLFRDLQENGDPEILKMLPTELAYRLKTSLNSAIIPMTKELPTTPYEEDIVEAIEKLHEWGILTERDDDEAILTPMGKQMSKIPLDLRGSQMVITALSLNIACDIIILASLLSIDQDPFSMPHPLKHPKPVEYAQEIRKVMVVKRQLDRGHLSEAFVYINLFRQFKTVYKKVRQYHLGKWCRENCVYKSRMTLWAHIVSRVAASIPHEFPGKQWLVGDNDRGPDTIPIHELRVFILLFGDVHPFLWSGKGKLVFAHFPKVFEEEAKLEYCMSQILGKQIHFSNPSLSNGKLKVTSDAQSYIDMLPLLRMKNGKPFIHLPLHPTEQDKCAVNELERKAMDRNPFHDIQLAVPSPVVSKSNLVIVERTFPWRNHEGGNITYCSARYVRNVIFPSGVTVLKDINVEKWEKVRNPPKGDERKHKKQKNRSAALHFHKRLHHIKTNAYPDETFLPELLTHLYESEDMRKQREMTRSRQVVHSVHTEREHHYNRNPEPAYQSYKPTYMNNPPQPQYFNSHPHYRHHPHHLQQYHQHTYPHHYRTHPHHAPLPHHYRRPNNHRSHYPPKPYPSYPRTYVSSEPTVDDDGGWMDVAETSAVPEPPEYLPRQI